MLHPGEERSGAGLSRRLDQASDGLIRSTSRHFGRRHEGWELSGVAGLDTPMMNRVSIREAPVDLVAKVTDEAHTFFGERAVPWSVVLASHWPQATWHSELVARGFTLSSLLNVMVRPPFEEPPVPSEDFEVRIATDDDLGVYTDLLLEVFHMPRRFYPALHDMTRSWRAAGGIAYLGYVDGKPVATTLLSAKEGIAGIYNVGTRSAFRRKGVSRAMMQRTFADACGAEIMTLQVAPGSLAEAFYLRLGFELAHTWRFYTPGPRAGLFF